MCKLIPMEVYYDYKNNNEIIVYDKRTNEPVLYLKVNDIISDTTWGPQVTSGYVIYKDCDKFLDARGRHLNLSEFFPENLNKHIGIATDDEYIYVQYFGIYGPSWGRGRKWNMRKYRYI